MFEDIDDPATSSDNFLLLISILLADIVPNSDERERERRELVTSVF